MAVTDSENTGQDDKAHLARSEKRGLVVLTNDDDFVRLSREHSHAGIVYYNDQDHEPGMFVTGIRRIDRYFEPEEMADHIEWLENWL